MKKSVFASIVLYKHSQQELQRTISSILMESEIEKLILIDNGGCEWAGEIEQNRIFYMKSPGNIGFGAGHNLAIKKLACKSYFFLICNPDIYFETGTISKLIKAAESSGSGLSMPNVLYPDGSRQELCKLLPTPVDLFARRFLPSLAKLNDAHYTLKHADFTQTQFIPSLSGCFMFCRSDALLELGGFDERYFMYMEDVDLSRRFAERYGSYFVPSATVVHDFQKGSYHNTRLLWIHLQSAIKYFNKWGWFFDKTRELLNKKCLSSLKI